MDALVGLVEHVGTPLTANAERSAHWSVRAAVAAEWRTAFGWKGRAIRTSVVAFPVGVEVWIVQPPRGRADAAGHHPIVKAAVDGLTDAGVWPDDDPAHVAWTRFHAPLRHASVPRGLVKVAIGIVILEDADASRHPSSLGV